MSKVVFISSMAGYPWGGSEELWSQTARRMKQEGFDVSAAVVWRRESTPKLQALQQGGIFVRMHSRHRASGAGRIARKLHRYLTGGDSEFRWLSEENPVLTVISQGYNQDGIHWMEYCRKMRLPYVAIVQANSESWWPKDEKLGELASGYRSAKRVFCVSRHNLSLLERQLGEQLPNGEVIWNPFNVPSTEPPPWPDNKVWKLACIARLDPPAKGQDLLLQALASSEWRNRPIEINFYGGGPYEQGLRKLAAALGLTNIRFHGQVADIRSIWETNHMLILPSRHEGLPLALVEAMWCARPAVLTDVGGNAELCVEGVTGIIAPAPTVSFIQQALETAWSRRESWQEMGRAARAHARELVPQDPVAEFVRRLKSSLN